MGELSKFNSGGRAQKRDREACGDAMEDLQDGREAAGPEDPQRSRCQRRRVVHFSILPVGRDFTYFR